MSYEEFWYCNPNRTKAYRKAEYRRIEKRNEELWLQGLYIYDAFVSVIGSMFSKSNSQKHEYIQKPIDILPKTEIEQMQEAQRQRDLLIKQLNEWAKRSNK